MKQNFVIKGESKKSKTPFQKVKKNFTKKKN